jgi:hypothetical protein
MHGKEDREFGSERAYCAQNPLQRLGVVNVGRPMQREHSVGSAARSVLPHAKPVENRRLCRHLAVPQQAVDHDIADEENLLRGHTFAS